MDPKLTREAKLGLAGVAAALLLWLLVRYIGLITGVLSRPQSPFEEVLHPRFLGGLAPSLILVYFDLVLLALLGWQINLLVQNPKQAHSGIYWPVILLSAAGIFLLRHLLFAFG